MKKLILGLCATALLMTSGCATEEYLKKQVDPLADRLAKVESRLDAMDKKLNQPAALDPADKAALQDALTTAKKALDTANKAEAEARNANAAATKAEEAANDAEKAARKTEKIFKLEQKK